MAKTNICYRHSEIDYWAKEIIEALDDDALTEKQVKKRIRSLVKKIRKQIEYALIDGQSMEDRLSAYRLAIETLGFKRIKYKK